MADNTFESDLFEGHLKTVDLAGETETVLAGGDRPFELVAEALADVGEIAIIGWSSQGPAQAQNLRDTLREAGSDTKVVVGLRPGSSNRASAEAAGFDLESGTLKTVEEALEGSDVSLMLIADAAMAKEGQELVGMMPEGSTLGLSHGFWLGHLAANGEAPRQDVDIIGVCPKGMGPSVRRLYEQGSGINTSFAVAQGGDVARDRALAWSLGLSAPHTFQTTLESEWKSDIFGERAILLGGVHGIVEAVYAYKRSQNVGAEQAYLETVESLVGPITETIREEGLTGVVEALHGEDHEKFVETYNAAYPAMHQLISKIYSDVSSGREIAEVVADNDLGIEMNRVDGTDMWRVGERVRSARGDTREDAVEIDPVVAGIYLAGMIAQADVLRANGHHWSEVVNESIIEAVDSLNPYMAKAGIAHMVDNCSTTARRGSRKWAPQFQAYIDQAVLPVIKGTRERADNTDHYFAFLTHDVHRVLPVLAQLRPPINIAV